MDQQKLFALKSAAGFDKRMHRKVEADHSEDGFNNDALVVGKAISVVLAHKGRGAQNRKKDEHQPGGLEPEGVKGAAYGGDK